MKILAILLITCANCLNLSSQSVQFNYICPVPDSKYINPEQVVILKTGYCYDPRSLAMVFVMLNGSETGPILSDLSLSEDLKTLFIRPFSKFTLGEEVDVFISPGLKTSEGKNISSTAFSFRIKEPYQPVSSGVMEEVEPEGSRQPERISPAQSIYSQGRDNNLPPDYPAPTSVYTGAGVQDGYIFFTPTVRLTPQFEKYITIWDNYGTPIFYTRVDETVTDFKVLDDGILTYAVNGLQNPEQNCYYLMDSDYQIYDSVRAGNGYDIDNHDILLLENGHYLIMIYDQQVVNMSLIVPGGNPNANVTGLVIQEVDLNGNVYFQWRSWDHYEITDATWDIDLTAFNIDYVHANALDLDSDGDILVSCRHMDEITKIDYTTGNIIWRFGLNAVNNQFTFLNDPVGFSHQHDIRKLANGNYTVFDNGNLHVPPFSQGLEYHLNETTMQATLIWDYQHDPIIYSPLTGGNQRLANNNRLIGWGGSSPLAITEVNSSNQVVFELYLPDNVTGYRARKYPWETTVFSTQNNIYFGNFEGYILPKIYLLQITNTYSQSIQITSAYNHLQDTYYTSNLPATIPPGGSVEIPVYFQPSSTGYFEDILTLNYDNFDNTRRIARQIKLHGLWDPEMPSLQFDPSNGAIDVDPHTDIVTTFSEPVRKIFGQELQDDDVPDLFIFRETNLFGDDIAFHGTVSADKTTITIIPDQVLDPQQQYFIRQKPDILEDYNGNVINYSDFCFFTTGDLVDIPAPADPSDIRIYPNPAKDVLVIQSGKYPVMGVVIVAADGRTVYSGSFNSKSVRLNLGDFPDGLFTIRILTSGRAPVSMPFIHH